MPISDATPGRSRTTRRGMSHADEIGVRMRDAKSTNSTQLVNLIGCEIVKGGFQPGSRLPDEATMLARYSVSRTALRETYGKLTAKGLIHARPKVGTRVRPQADWNMLDSEVLTWHLQTMPPETLATDLYALRRMVEPSAAALAAEARSDEALEQIAAAYAEMKACSEGGGDLIDADFRFHLAILSATQNHFIGAFSSLIRAAMISTFRLSWRGAAEIQDARLFQHENVLEAIRQRNPDLARKAMEELLDDSIKDVHEALEQKL